MSDEEHSETAPPPALERKLTAIFSTDVKGYSRLMGDDEVATVHAITASRAVLTSLIE